VPSHRGVVAHTGLRSERVRIFRRTFSGHRRGKFLFIAQHKKERKSLPSDTISGLKMYPKCFCSRGSSPNPAGGVYSAPPNSLTGYGEPLRGKEGRGTGREGKGGRIGIEGEEKVERLRVEGGQEGGGAGVVILGHFQDIGGGNFCLLFSIKKNPNRCHQTRFMGSKCTQNAFAAEALPRTLLGELTALPQTP